MKPGIADLGYEVAAEAVLPCPEGSQTCEQQQVAIQRMQDAGVDFVFLVAQTLAGSATVEAAQNLGYKPQWATIGNNVTDTVAKFYTNAKDDLRRCVRPVIAFTDWTPATADCNQIAVAGGAEEFPQDSDGYGFTGVTCLQTPVAGAGDRCSRRHDRPGVGDRRAAAARSGADDLRTERHAERRQARRGNVGVPRRSTPRRHEQFDPVDDRKPLEVEG